jgi:hypothetical protein
MNTATKTFNEAIHDLAAGYRNDLAAQALAIHQQRDRAEAVLKARIAELEGKVAEQQERITFLDALASERATSAFHAMDDLAGSVLAEEAQAAAAAESEGEVIEVSDGEGEAPASSSSASSASAPRANRGGRKMTGLMPEGLTHDQQLKWAYDAYNGPTWAATYKKKKMPAECVTLDAQAKWCLEVAYPAFKAEKIKKAKDSSVRYKRKREAAMSASMGGGGSSSSSE